MYWLTVFENLCRKKLALNIDAYYWCKFLVQVSWVCHSKP